MKRVLALLATLAVVAAGCSGDAEEPLTVYSGRSEELIGPILEMFTEETGIEVALREGQSAELALLIEQEGANSPADVFISQSPGALGLLAGADLLAPQGDDTLALVPDEFRNAAGEWIGITGRVRVLVYNSELVDVADLPSSIFDVTDGSYAAQVAVAPANGSFQDFVTGMREVHGDDTTLAWLSDLAANDAQVYANNSAIVQAVARGEVNMGLVNHYYNLRALAEDPSLPSRNHFLDDVGSLVIITGAGTLKSSSQPEKAAQLIEFLLSGTAQSFFTDETFEYPLATSASPAAGLPSLDEIRTTTYDFDDIAGGLGLTQELINDSGLESP